MRKEDMRTRRDEKKKRKKSIAKEMTEMRIINNG